MADDPTALRDEDARITALPIHDERKYADTLDLVGEATAKRLLGRLIDQLQAAFQGDEDRAVIAREAHALISTSGLLGCDRLSELCRDLEEAAKAGLDLRGRLCTARRTRDLTAAALLALRD
ncbi:Hpt domain-containing protein [Methylobacterium nodulans]|uniref:Hpt protein n=1 Tax=Methylobacterium nodulans (strain LMG 21967 / CNCM I-2342 / ORS 2060) TaxID=460265 RepID=B8IKT0_METNO|nr:Hpt domain-containing protein [Methylobacterium nodulans]ACL56287.1 Hpt protein [Methylobacterium nodulans ORS 2060]